MEERLNWVISDVTETYLTCKTPQKDLFWKEKKKKISRFGNTDNKNIDI
jgi:hypothetical protein